MKKLLLARFVPWFPVACRWLGRAALAVATMGTPVFFASTAMENNPHGRSPLEDPLNRILVALWAIWIGSMVLFAWLDGAVSALERLTHIDTPTTRPGGSPKSFPDP